MKVQNVKSAKKNRGSITVEASISLIAFVFFIVSIVSLINICRVQTKVGNALHLAALDISHYSYLYYITGLYDMDVSIQSAGSSAGDKLVEKAKGADELLANTETLLGLLENSKEDAENVFSGQEELQTAVENGQANLETGKSTIQDMKGNFSQIAESAKGIADNPIIFLKTLLQYGIGSGFNQAKNFLAGVFAKALMEDHIEVDGTITDADAYLERLGVVDGLDGMHFGASQLYSGSDHADINLVVMYEVRIFPLFTKLTVPFAQSASTRAWLMGDAEHVQAEATESKPEQTKEEDPKEESEEEQEEEPEEEPEEGIWRQGNFERYRTLSLMIAEEQSADGHYVKANDEGNPYFGHNDVTNTLYMGNSIDIFAKSYRKADGSFNANSLKDRIFGHLDRANTYKQSFVMEGGGVYNLPEEVNVDYVLYIPDNASEEEIQALQGLIDEWKASHPDTGDGISSLNISIQKIGGESDGTQGERLGKADVVIFRFDRPAVCDRRVIMVPGTFADDEILRAG